MGESRSNTGNEDLNKVRKGVKPICPCCNNCRSTRRQKRNDGTGARHPAPARFILYRSENGLARVVLGPDLDDCQ